MAGPDSSSPLAPELPLDSEDHGATKSDLQASKVKGRAESSSLKRGRAESVEPTHPSDSTPLLGTAKKNRLAPSTGQTPSKPLDPDASPNIHYEAIQPKIGRVDETDERDETRNVGEVRRKVEKMSYDEGALETDQKEEQSVIVEVPPKDETGGPDSAMSIATRSESEAGADEQDAQWEKIDKSELAERNEEDDRNDDNGQDGLKRKALDRSESSFVGQDEDSQAKKKKDESTNSPKKIEGTTASIDDKTEIEAPKVKDPVKQTKSFSSFSSNASPFASTSTASPFATKTSGGSAFGSTSASTPSKSIFSSSGFGGYSSSFSPFAAKKSAPAAEIQPTTEDEGVKAGPSSFGDILKAGGEDQAEDVDDEAKVQMTEQDVHTGEEEEETLFQTRTKLYVMQADGGWKERGLGVLKLNVRRHDGKGARLVMRADGVLRVILNVSLYVGMSCLEDGKHVRMTVFENGERQLVTFRTGSNKAATELSGAIHEHIPLESSVPPRSPDPSGPADNDLV